MLWWQAEDGKNGCQQNVTLLHSWQRRLLKLVQEAVRTMADKYVEATESKKDTKAKSKKRDLKSHIQQLENTLSGKSMPPQPQREVATWASQCFKCGTWHFRRNCPTNVRQMTNAGANGDNGHPSVPWYTSEWELLQRIQTWNQRSKGLPAPQTVCMLMPNRDAGFQKQTCLV